MKPSKVIKLECKYCLGYEGTRKNPDCESITCNLNKQSLSKLKLIKAHCLECSPEHSYDSVKSCNGKLLGHNRLCYLHPFRIGKNPFVKKLLEYNTKNLIKAGIKTRFTKQRG